MDVVTTGLYDKPDPKAYCGWKASISKSTPTFSVCFRSYVTWEDASKGHVKGNLPEGLCAPLKT